MNGTVSNSASKNLIFPEENSTASFKNKLKLQINPEELDSVENFKQSDNLENKKN